MYLWDLVGHDTAEGSLRSGLGDDLPAIMRIAEPLLVKRVGFAVRIIEVVPRVSVFHLDAIHVPTGREWLGRRDIHGGAYWTMKDRPVDPGLAYQLAAGQDTGAVAS
ncbi:MAG: hypothetical protein ACRDNS_35320 [Trebonia sp.]